VHSELQIACAHLFSKGSPPALAQDGMLSVAITVDEITCHVVYHRAVVLSTLKSKLEVLLVDSGQVISLSVDRIRHFPSNSINFKNIPAQVIHILLKHLWQ
jgi:hypothetical protein